MRFRVLFLMLLAVVAGSAARAQDAPTPISAGSVRELALARTVRYADFAPFPDGDAAQPLSGWFTLSPDGTKVAFVIHGGVRIIRVDGAQIPDVGWTRSEATVIDAHWDDASQRLAVIYQDADGYALSLWSEAATTTLTVNEVGVPVRVWFDAEIPDYVWIEVTPAPEDPDRSGFQVVRLDLSDPQNDAPLTLPTGPEHDFDSLVRIGRIPAPLAITATFTGAARRWDLQTGEITAEVELPATPTFGRVNETNGVEFAWRDEASTALHLLNFETGADKIIAPLDGDYIQALLLTPDASVILAVHRGDTPDLTAWITASGEEVALGRYDTSVCSRVPDMVQLARNGSRLVIGCDGGYQVWEISE
ncbi:MAG: hypothetical protein IPK52_08400 [Chloroflexi bacterium]|nr:hypothetical protein [Chloroflexota bacterium]